MREGNLLTQSSLVEALISPKTLCKLTRKMNHHSGIREAGALKPGEGNVSTGPEVEGRLGDLESGYRMGETVDHWPGHLAGR